VVAAERAGRILGEGIAIPLAVSGTKERSDDVEIPLVDAARLAPEVGEPKVDVQLEELDPRRSLAHGAEGTEGVGRYAGVVAAIRFGPARVPSREAPEAAIELLLERGYTANEIDFEGGFWMDYPWAERFGELARDAGVALSVHAPIAGFMGHVERDKKQRMAVGMLDHSAGIAVACGAELVVFHPGFLLGRRREDAIASVVEQLAELRQRLEAKGRGVPFGIEIMGRVRELGTAEDVFAISAQLGWVRPVLDFAHLHAVTDGAFVEVESFAGVLAAADSILEPDAPFHVHFSDIAYANRNETKHLRYGEGTLNAEPLAEALARFERPATVISESPDDASHQGIRAVLLPAAARR
jgi:deoxyribonuclease IV